MKVSEALHKGKPVVAYRAGGIPLQIDQGKSGYLVDIGDTRAVAEHLYTLLTDDNHYQKMSEYAAKCVNPNHFTIFNAAKWLYLANMVLAGEKIQGQGTAVQQLASLPAAVC